MTFEEWVDNHKSGGGFIIPRHAWNAALEAACEAVDTVSTRTDPLVYKADAKAAIRKLEKQDET